MILLLALACLGIGVMSASLASAPATDFSRRRSAARRAAFVAQNPTHVNSGDILAALVAEGMDAGQAHFVLDRGRELGIRPFTMWLWLVQSDARALGIVVAADLTHTELLTHISNGTMPDLDELEVFATANGFEVTDEAGTRRPRTAAGRSGLRGAARTPSAGPSRGIAA